jgi:hypothetical protein
MWFVQRFFGVLLAIAAVGGLALATIWWRRVRSRAILQAWAETNGYRILRQQYRFFFTGPFFPTIARGQAVYYVTVRDQGGVIRHCWVRCGSWWLGLLSDKVQVRSEDLTF